MYMCVLGGACVCKCGRSFCACEWVLEDVCTYVCASVRVCVCGGGDACACVRPCVCVFTILATCTHSCLA